MYLDSKCLIPRSGLDVNVVLFSTQLDLRDNTTCQLVRSGPRNIHLYTVDVDIFSKGTPLGEFNQSMILDPCLNLFISLFQIVSLILQDY